MLTNNPRPFSGRKSEQETDEFGGNPKDSIPFGGHKPVGPQHTYNSWSPISERDPVSPQEAAKDIVQFIDERTESGFLQKLEMVPEVSPETGPVAVPEPVPASWADWRVTITHHPEGALLAAKAPLHAPAISRKVATVEAALRVLQHLCDERPEPARRESPQNQQNFPKGETPGGVHVVAYCTLSEK